MTWNGRAVNTVPCPTCGITAYAVEGDDRGRWHCDVHGFFDLPRGAAPWCFKNLAEEIGIGEVKPGAGVVFADANGHVIFPQEYAGRIVRAVNNFEKVMEALAALEGPETGQFSCLHEGQERLDLEAAYVLARGS